MSLDQDRANAFIQRLVKSVTPDRTNVWIPGMSSKKPPETRKQHVINAASKQRREQLEASKLGERGHATVHSHGQHPRVVREYHHSPLTFVNHHRPRRITEPATKKERLVGLANIEGMRKRGIRYTVENVPQYSLEVLQRPEHHLIPSPRHFYVGDEGYRGRD